MGRHCTWSCNIQELLPGSQVQRWWRSGWRWRRWWWWTNTSSPHIHFYKEIQLPARLWNEFCFLACRWFGNCLSFQGLYLKDWTWKPRFASWPGCFWALPKELEGSWWCNSSRWFVLLGQKWDVIIWDESASFVGVAFNIDAAIKTFLGGCKFNWESAKTKVWWSTEAGNLQTGLCNPKRFSTYVSGCCLVRIIAGAESQWLPWAIHYSEVFAKCAWWGAMCTWLQLWCSEGPSNPPQLGGCVSSAILRTWCCGKKSVFWMHSCNFKNSVEGYFIIGWCLLYL